jgi:hypothetical protein
LHLGAAYTTASSFNYAGYIDDFAIWNGAGLTQEQVQQLFLRQGAKYSGKLTSRVMDYGSSILWDGIKWISTLPFGKELPGDSNNSGSMSSADSETHSDYSSLVGSTGSTSDDNLMSSLIALWHLNGTNGVIADNATAADSAGGTYNGTVKDGDASNTIKYEQGIFSQGVKFDGSNDYIEVGTPDVTTAFTLSAWVKIHVHKDYNQIFLRNDSNNTFYGLMTTATGALYAEVKNGTTSIFNSTGTIATNRWNHVALVFDKTLGSSNIKFYINGVADATTGSNTKTFGTFNGAIANIGRDAVNGRYMNGIIDEVALWGRALTAAEMLQLYRRGANRLLFQVRTCDDNACSGEDWVGPTNSKSSFFSELYNYAPYNYDTNNCSATNLIITGSPSLLFSCFTSSLSNLTSQNYFQYRAILESDDTSTQCNYGSGATWCSPELKSVEAKP